MKLGIDYVGGVNYIRVICNWHPSGFAAGFLLRASGWQDGMAAARALAKTGKMPVCRIHGLWLDKVGKHYQQEHIRPAVLCAKRLNKFAEAFPEIKLYYSPWLEHRASAKLWKECRKQVRKVLAPEIRIVSSGPAPAGMVEVHGRSQAPASRYIYSYDGEDMLGSFPAQVAKRKEQHSKAALFMGWCPACNGKTSVTDKTHRECRTNWLKREDIERMEKLLRRE
jgi:hypothetical protein